LTSTNEHRQSTFNADFGSISVDGFTFFNGATFAGDVSFRNARIQNLVLDNVNWLGKRNLRLEGLTYQRIRAVTNELFVLGAEDLKKSWEKLRDLLHERTPYSFDVYDSLEAYFQREGRPELADAAFLESKRRERVDASLTARCWSTFLDWTVGQGRDPGRAFLLSLIPLAFGALLFQRKNMTVSEDKRHGEDPPYNSLWFSLAMLLPELDLWLKNKWEPKPKKQWLWAYACLHKFAGWVLIPVGLAAFAGIVK